MCHLGAALHHAGIVVGPDDRHRNRQGVTVSGHIHPPAGRQLLVPLHHDLKVFVDLVVLGFGARRERIAVFRFRRIGRHGAIFVLLLCVYLQLDNVLVRQRFVRLVILGVLQQDLVHVGARVLVQFVGAAEDD